MGLARREVNLYTPCAYSRLKRIVASRRPGLQTRRITMKRLGLALIVAVAVLVVGTAVNGQTPRATLPHAAVAELDTLMATEMKTAKVPGASLAIVWGNKPVYSKAFGMADLEHNI